jgi:hypothetical protein
MAQTSFSGPVVSRAGFINGADALVPVTASTLTVTPEAHSGRLILLDRAAGQAVTLPAATGTGNIYEFFVLTTVTGSTTIKVVGNDVMAGVAMVANDTDASASLFETAADSDTITFNGTTTGGVRGARVTLQDVAADLWHVQIGGAASAGELTPFSPTVT